MISLALIRHGPTVWNEQKRLQGQTDIPLSPDGLKQVEGWSLPTEFSNFKWFASPLTRAQQTAELLGLTVETEPSIIEMHWGDWEGQTGKELKEKLGDDCVNLVIVTTGTTAYRRTDGVAVVPLALLGP